MYLSEKRPLYHNRNAICLTNNLIATEGIYDLYERTYEFSVSNLIESCVTTHSPQSRHNVSETE